MSAALREASLQALSALEAGDLLCEVVAAGILRAALAVPHTVPAAYIRTQDLAELQSCNGFSVWAESAAAHADNPGLTAGGLTPVYAGPPIPAQPLSHSEYEAMLAAWHDFKRHLSHPSMGDREVFRWGWDARRRLAAPPSPRMVRTGGAS